MARMDEILLRYDGFIGSSAQMAPRTRTTMTSLCVPLSFTENFMLLCCCPCNAAFLLVIAVLVLGGVKLKHISFRDDHQVMLLFKDNQEGSRCQQGFG
jgi:hypothetical protein